MARRIDLGKVTGPQGPQGETGPQGPQGDTSDCVKLTGNQTIKGTKEFFVGNDLHGSLNIASGTLDADNDQGAYGSCALNLKDKTGKIPFFIAVSKAAGEGKDLEARFYVAREIGGENYPAYIGLLISSTGKRTFEAVNVDSVKGGGFAGVSFPNYNRQVNIGTVESEHDIEFTSGVFQAPYDCWLTIGGKSVEAGQRVALIVNKNPNNGNTLIASTATSHAAGERVFVTVPVPKGFYAWTEFTLPSLSVKRWSRNLAY